MYILSALAESVKSVCNVKLNVGYLKPWFTEENKFLFNKSPISALARVAASLWHYADRISGSAEKVLMSLIRIALPKQYDVIHITTQQLIDGQKYESGKWWHMPLNFCERSILRALAELEKLGIISRKKEQHSYKHRTREITIHYEVLFDPSLNETHDVEDEFLAVCYVMQVKEFRMIMLGSKKSDGKPYVNFTGRFIEDEDSAENGHKKPDFAGTSYVGQGCHIVRAKEPNKDTRKEKEKRCSSSNFGTTPPRYHGAVDTPDQNKSKNPRIRKNTEKSKSKKAPAEFPARACAPAHTPACERVNGRRIKKKCRQDDSVDSNANVCKPEVSAKDVIIRTQNAHEERGKSKQEHAIHCLNTLPADEIRKVHVLDVWNLYLKEYCKEFGYVIERTISHENQHIFKNAMKVIKLPEGLTRSDLIKHSIRSWFSLLENELSWTYQEKYGGNPPEIPSLAFFMRLSEHFSKAVMCCYQSHTMDKREAAEETDIKRLRNEKIELQRELTKATKNERKYELKLDDLVSKQKKLDARILEYELLVNKESHGIFSGNFA